MAIACPNKNMSEWKELAERFGDNLAESLYYRNDGQIPSLQEAQAMIRGSKISQFKNIARYLDSSLSPDPNDLINNMFRVVQKVGTDLYVVKGSKLHERPASGAEAEIHGANVKFLNAINESVGPLFKLTKVADEGKTESLANDLINSLKESNQESITGLTYKNLASDETEHQNILKELTEQLGNRSEREGLEETLGTPLFEKVVAYNDALKNKTPDVSKLFSQPNPETELISKEYKANQNIQTSLGTEIYKIDTKYAKRIADAFTELQHNPSDPVVKEAYTAMAKETIDQYNAIKKAGYNIETYEGNGEPYKNSAEMIADVRDNKHLYILSTENDFGQNAISDEQREENPLLKDSGKKDINGKPLLVNDIFRFVHDFFGHTERGNSFGPVGEENAWDVHSRMYSDLARRAMTTETRGQNSWVNFGEHMRDSAGRLLTKGEAGYLDPTKRPYAEQKIGLLPEEFSTLPESQGIERPGDLKVAPGTYKVDINSQVLADIASRNIDKTQKENVEDQKEVLDNNKTIIVDKPVQYSKDYGPIQVASVNHNILDNLKQKFNLPYEVVNDGTVNWKGKFENGKIYINAAKVDEYTALHEFLHPFTGAMKQDNPELYNNLINELQTSESGKKAIEDTQKNYPELSPKDQLDEALVKHLSEIANSEKIKSTPWYKQLMDWFRKIFGMGNVSISGLDLNMRLNDIANKIVDPTYTADLKKYQELNNAATNFQKENPDYGFSENFNNIVEKVKNKLTLDVNVPAKTKEQEQRKFFSGKQLADLQNNKDAYGALNDYVRSSIINAKKINEKFDEFKSLYESKGGKLDKDEMLKGMNILSEMEQHVALYNESRFVVDAVSKENPDEFDDNFRVLANRLNGDASIINNYHDYGLKLMSDWLYPTMRKTIDNIVKSGNIEKMPGYNEYLAIKAASPNIEFNDAVEQGVKKWLRGQMEHATSDIGFFNSYMTGVLNSKDPISQLVGLSLKEEFGKNNTKLFNVKTSIENVVKKAIGKKLFTSNKDHKEFYGKFLHQVDSYEKTGYDEKTGDAIFGYVKRTAFHEPYRNDEFYKAKRTMFQEIGIRPNKNDERAYSAWAAKRDAWFDQHTVRNFNDKGEVISTVPSNKYINPEYAKVANDPVFKELTGHYNDANSKLGKYQLKYGIVPQQEHGGGTLSDFSFDKGIKGNLEVAKQGLKNSLSSKLGSYYAQDIDGKEYRNVPVRWTRFVDEKDLSYNMAKSVADFWEGSSKYASAKNIEPMVLTLRNFIEGNSFLKIGERDAPEVDAKGVRKLGNYVKNITKTKEQPNINRQLVDFLNDTVYGESEKKANIKSPFLNLKYMVYKKGDTSANGKPHREYIYSLEDLKKKTGSESIEHDHFTKGAEKDVNGYGVTLISNDKILSVNKLGKKLNSLSAAINLGGNVIAGTSHLLRGVASNFIEATGGKYFNHKEWLGAYKEYFKNLTNFSYLEDTRGGKGSKDSQLLTHYGTFQGEFLNEFGKHIGQGVVNKLFKRSSLFFAIHGAEHMIQTTQMIAAMKHVKMSDGKTSLYDAWEKGEDGNIKIKQGLKWDDKQDNDFKNLVQSINKDRGNYSEFDKAALSRLWWGKMIIMFRRHIFNGIKARWGSSYVDYERGGATQGYYRSFITSLSNEFNEFRLNGKFRKLTPDEAYNAKKTLADIGMFAMLAGVMVPAFKPKEDEDKNGIDSYAALFARRLQMDVSFFYNPLEWKKVIQSPIVTGSTVDKFAGLFQQMATSPSEVYEKDGAGYSAGDNKLVHKAGQLIPGYRVLLNLQQPEDLLKFYGISRKPTQNEQTNSQ
jgi:rubrerythrin